MTMTTTAPVAQRTNVWAETEHLAHMVPVLVLNQFGDQHSLPKNKGSILSMRRWDVKDMDFDVSGNPVTITEGVNPSGGDIAYSNVEATIQQYGDFVEITDRVVDEYEDPVRQDATEHNGEQAGQFVELACWGAVRGGTNVVYANGTARNQVNTAVNKNMIDNIERTLMANKAQHIRKILSGDMKTDTMTVKAGYVIVGHTDLLHDFEALDGWIPYQKYASQDRINDYEEGTIGKFRVILSPTLTKWADAGADSSGAMVETTDGTTDVYPFIAFGQHAFGHIKLKGEGSIKAMIRQPNNPDSGDELGLTGSIGWKTRYVAKITAEFWIVRGEVGVTALS